jgi:hypothetical protein
VAVLFIDYARAFPNIVPSIETQPTKNIMGAWGAGSFENDSAGDWADELLHSADATPILEAFSAVIECEDYLEVDEASAALAAAEVVAALRQQPSSTLPSPVAAWVRDHADSLSPELPELAVRAVALIKNNSELKELWDEGDTSQWLGAVEDLEHRLQTG